VQLLILASGRGSRLNQKKRVPKLFIKIEKKTLFDLNEKFYDYFDNKVIIAGYQFNLVRKNLNNKNYQIVNNKNYKITNMVYSMFLAQRYVKEDVVVVYSDVIFKKNIINAFQSTGSIVPINKNWLKLWKKRMSLKNIFNDAEDLKINKKYVVHIGTKIKKLPKYQYMGMVKFTKKDFFNLYNFFKKIKNNKIDMTSFLNHAIHAKILKLRFFKTSCKWLEIDNNRDLKVAKSEFRKW
jgi:choline kinase